EQRQRFGLLLFVHVDQAQSVARCALDGSIVPDIAAIVAEWKPGGLSLLLGQRTKKYHRGRGHATRRRGGAIGGAQVNCCSHGSRSCRDLTTAYARSSMS